MVLAPIVDGREASLRALLASMNVEPGRVDPANAILPFGAIEELHFARLVILDDTTLRDLDRYGLPRPQVPRYLAFMGDCDGPSHALLAALAREHHDGLRTLFAHCVGFDDTTDLAPWLLDHDLPVDVFYVNTVGRTVRQVHEESALQRTLSARARSVGVGVGDDPQVLRRALVEHVRVETDAGRLALTPTAPTPVGWGLANAVHAIGVPLIGLLLAPLFLVVLPFALIALRRHERADPEYCPRPDANAVLEMQHMEDRDLTNSFTALGAVKPGWFRLALLRLILIALDWTARHLFNRGFLTRVQTIHFARWVFIDDRRRVLFASNYDGSHESYMDDFINKVGWGLNLVFSNGFGWPHTDWLVIGGSRREMAFKHYQRRHQLPNQVWYKAYTGLTLRDLDRNARIRQGLEASSMNDAQARAWLRLL